MLKQETINVNDVQLIRTYSDAGKFIIQNETGAKYTEAIDIPYKYTYSESDEYIPVEEEENIDEQQPV